MTIEIAKCWKINMTEIDPGAIGFTSGFSQEHKYLRLVNKLLLSN